jgi:hypothetical protein
VSAPIEVIEFRKVNTRSYAVYRNDKWWGFLDRTYRRKSALGAPAHQRWEGRVGGKDVSVQTLAGAKAVIEEIKT